MVLFSCIVAFLNYIFDSKFYKYFSLLLILVIAIIVPGVRDSVTGTDSLMYANFLSYNYSIGEWFKLIEPFNALIYSFYQKYGDNNYSHIFFIYSIITNIFLLFGIYKTSRNIPLSLGILFMFNCFYFLQINIMRQAVAMAICLYAVNLLLTYENIKYYIIILFACLFHTSAAICFLFPLFRYFLNKNFVVFCMLSVFIFTSLPLVSDFIIRILSSGGGIFEKYSHYMNGRNQDGSGKKMFFLDLVVVVGLIFLSDYKKLFSNMEFRFFFYMILVLLSLLFSISFLGLDPMGLGRVHYFFYIGLIFGLPYVFECIRKEYRAFAYLIFFSFLVFNFYFYLYVFHSVGYLPYLISDQLF